MKRGYNELVGLQATFNRKIPRYALTHHYRWRENGKTKATGTMRSFDLHRDIPASEVMRSLRDAYAPAVLSIWQHVTKSVISEYYQFEVGAMPCEVGLDGYWRLWAER